MSTQKLAILGFSCLSFGYCLWCWHDPVAISWAEIPITRRLPTNEDHASAILFAIGRIIGFSVFINLTKMVGPS